MKPERFHPHAKGMFPDNPTGASCTTCGHFACVCLIRSTHKPDCKFLKASTGAIGIECEHGRDVCPICDPCTCGVTPK